MGKKEYPDLAVKYDFGMSMTEAEARMYMQGKRRQAVEDLHAMKEFFKIKEPGGWIRTKEKLPENLDWELLEVTTESGIREVAYYDRKRGIWWSHDRTRIFHVIAWKRPTEPYKGE